MFDVSSRENLVIWILPNWILEFTKAYNLISEEIKRLVGPTIKLNKLNIQP